MPLYEFVCADCGEPFEELVLSSAQMTELTCPACGSPQVKKKISTFASRVAGKVSFSASSSAACSTGST